MLSPLDLGSLAFQPGTSDAIRKRTVVVGAAMATISFLIATATFFWHAHEERHAIAHRGLSAAAESRSLPDRTRASDLNSHSRPML